MDNLSLLLSRLRRVRENGYRRFDAACPVCNAPMEVDHDSTGRIQLGCKRVCHPEHILRAVGLTWHVLFPPGVKPSPMDPEWWRHPPRYARGPVRPKGEQ